MFDVYNFDSGHAACRDVVTVAGFGNAGDRNLK